MESKNQPMDTYNSDLDDATVNKLLRLSSTMKERSYCPYSRFPVGAALLCEDGTVYSGCNVENGSFQMCICAERTAIVKAVSEGHTKFKAIFVASNLKDEYIVPCGACRQFMTEFGTGWDVYMTKPNATYVRMSVEDLCPNSPPPTAMLARMRNNCCAGADKTPARTAAVSAGPSWKDSVIEC